MRRAFRQCNAVRPRYSGRNQEPLERRAVLLRHVGVLHEHRQPNRHFAGRDQIGEQRVALTYRHAVGRDNVAKKFQPRLLTQQPDQHPEPVVIVGLDAELSFERRIEQVRVALRQRFWLHQIDIVHRGEDVDARPDPLAVRTHRLLDEVLEVR